MACVSIILQIDGDFTTYTEVGVVGPISDKPLKQDLKATINQTSKMSIATTGVKLLSVSVVGFCCNTRKCKFSLAVGLLATTTDEPSHSCCPAPQFAIRLKMRTLFLERVPLRKPKALRCHKMAIHRPNKHRLVSPLGEGPRATN